MTTSTSHVRRVVCARLPTPQATFRLCLYRSEKDGKEHLALILGQPAAAHAPLVRVHSECFTGDVLGSLRCDCGEQLQRSLEMIAREGTGVLIYLRQEGRGIGLVEKLRAYNLQDQGYDTVEANVLLGHQADERDYDVAAAILQDLGVTQIRLLTNNPEKIQALEALGIRVVERVPLVPSVNPENLRYLVTKVVRMGHLLNLEALGNGPPLEEQGEPEPPLPLLEWWRGEPWPRHRPWVTLAYAQSIDGSLARSRSQPTLLSSPESKRLTHRLRSLHDGILVGIGTVLADDPKLTARRANGPHPQPVVLDSRLRMPLQANLWKHPKGLWLVTTPAADPKRLRELAAQGARIFQVEADEQGRVRLDQALHVLRQAGIRTLMVEGGGRVLTAFLQSHRYMPLEVADNALACSDPHGYRPAAQGLVDAVAITLAPCYLAGVPSVEALPSPIPLRDVRYIPVGRDLWLWGRLS